MEWVVAILYLLSIAYYVWAIATSHFVTMTRPGFIVGFGVFMAVGFGALGRGPLMLRALAVGFGLLMSTHAYLVRRRQREGSGAA